MTWRYVRLEFAYLKKAFGQYHSGRAYLLTRFFKARRIFRHGPVQQSSRAGDLSIHVLLSHRDLVQALWSLTSWFLQGAAPEQLFLHSDGSLTARDCSRLQYLVPSSRIVTPEDGLASLSQLAGYPVIQGFRKTHGRRPFVLKLIDSYAVSAAKYHLLFDTDVLWFRNPLEIMRELASPHPRSYMICDHAARAFPSYVSFTDGTRLPDDRASFNAGIVFYHRSRFNLDKLTEYLSRFDPANERNFYFVEQAGHASILEHLEGLPPDSYFVRGTFAPSTVARHYTQPRRPLFWVEGVPRVHRALGL